MLQQDPAQRPSAEELLCDPYFAPPGRTRVQHESKQSGSQDAAQATVSEAADTKRASASAANDKAQPRLCVRCARRVSCTEVSRLMHS